MSMNKKTKRKLCIIAVTAVLLTAVFLGLWFFFQYKNDQKTVDVVPVSQIADYYWPEQSSSSGMVVSNYVQELYPDPSKAISEVFVQEGQEVSIGDPLLQYDKTKLELDVKAKDIALKEIDLKIDTAQKQLTRLRNTKPAATPRPTTRPTATPRPTSRPTTSPRPTATPTPVPPSDVTVYSRLDLNSLPYEGSGTSEDPYVFLCTSDCIITAEFLKWLLGEGAEPEPTLTPTPTPEPGSEPEESGGEGEDGEPTPTPTPEPTPTPRPSSLASPFAAIFEVRDGNSNYGQLISSFKLDGTQLSGGFQMAGTIPGYNSLDSVITLFGASPTPNNYNDMGYTAAELNRLINEKKQEITDLQHDRKQAQLDLDKSNLQLRNSTVLSNVDGVVRTLIDLETASQENKPFLVVSGDSTYYVSGAVSESLLGLVQVGDVVSVNDYMNGGTYSARIVSIADYPLEANSNLYFYGNSNPNSSNYEFTAVIEDQVENLQSGSYVDISLNVQDEEAQNALYIQKAYIREDNGGSYVMKAGIDNRLKKQYVRTGKSLYGSSLEIKSGLTLDDYIAFPYGADVKEGVRVKVEGSEEGPVFDSSSGEPETSSEGEVSSAPEDLPENEDGENDSATGLPEGAVITGKDESGTYFETESGGGVILD